MKVAIYARISTDNLGQDVDRQLHETNINLSLRYIFGGAQWFQFVR